MRMIGSARSDSSNGQRVSELHSPSAINENSQWKAWMKSLNTSDLCRNNSTPTVLYMARMTAQIAPAWQTGTIDAAIACNNTCSSWNLRTARRIRKALCCCYDGSVFPQIRMHLFVISVHLQTEHDIPQAPKDCHSGDIVKGKLHPTGHDDNGI